MMKMEASRIVIVAFMVLLLGGSWTFPAPAEQKRPDSGPGDEWAQWRGPNRDGRSPTIGLPQRWQPEELKPRWRRQLGEGFSGIAIAGGRLYTQFSQNRDEFLVALDARYGHEIWRFAMGRALTDGHGNGPRATPAIEGGVVYALGSLGKLVAVTAEDGRPIWQLELANAPRWGYCSSPLVEGDLVIVNGPGGEAAVLAVDKATGERVWVAGQDHPGYASPIAVTLGGRRQILSFIAAGLVGLAADSGEELWRVPWKTSFNVNAADPIFLPPDRIFLSSAYGNGALLVRVEPGGEAFRVEEIWRNPKMKNHFNSSVVVGESLYGFDSSTLKCIAIATGETRWAQRGFGKGSLITADGKLIVLGAKGALTLVEATPEEYRELGRVQALDHHCLTSPALAGRWLYLRNHQEIVCFTLAADEANGGSRTPGARPHPFPSPVGRHRVPRQIGLRMGCDQGRGQPPQARGVSFEAARSVFNDPFSITYSDPGHSATEGRYITMGISLTGKILLVVHTDRQRRIRIISARKVTAKERRTYEERA